MSLILIDGNHYGFWSAAADNSMAGDVPVGAIRGFLDKMRQIRMTFSGHMFVLWDGKSWRAKDFKSYKEGRDKNEALVKLKGLWKQQRPAVGQALQLLGIPQVIAWNYEADDLARLMTSRTKAPVTLMTGDKDWAQLYEENRVRWVDLKETRRIFDQESFERLTGCETVWRFIQTKALCGDTGDSIPSIGNFGPKAADELFAKFGSAEGAINEALLDANAGNGCSKRVRDFLNTEEKQEAYRRNLRLVWLSHPDVPKPENMRIVKQERDVEALQKFCAQRAFPQAYRMNEWLTPFLGK